MKPVKIALVWEDRHFDGLRAVGRAAARQLRKEPPSLPPSHLFDDSIQGYGGLKSHVRRDWARMRAHGLPKSPGPIDHIIYVLDADVAHEFLDIDPLPGSESTDSWHRLASQALEGRIRGWSTRDPERAHGILLRWAKESLILAAHDIDEAIGLLNRDASVDRARESLYADCSPDPRRVEDADFIETFRSTKQCMEVVQASFGLGKLRKSDSRTSEVLRKAAGSDIHRLLGRIPDLRALAEKIIALSHSIEP